MLIKNVQVSTWHIPEGKHFIFYVTSQGATFVFYVTQAWGKFTALYPVSKSLSECPSSALFCYSTKSPWVTLPTSCLTPSFCWQLIPGQLSAVVSWLSPTLSKSKLTSSLNETLISPSYLNQKLRNHPSLLPSPPSHVGCLWLLKKSHELAWAVVFYSSTSPLILTPNPLPHIATRGPFSVVILILSCPAKVHQWLPRPSKSCPEPLGGEMRPLVRLPAHLSNLVPLFLS